MAFHPEMIVADALAAHPHVRWVFAAYHLGHCNSCDRRHYETLQQLADGYRVSLDQLLADLNSLARS